MEYTSKVLLDDDFLSVFYPFYYINTILCVRKYNIYNNWVKIVTRKNFMCAIFINCLMLCFYCLVMKFSRFDLAFQLVYYFVYFVYAFTFGAVCVLNLYFSRKSVRLLSILYKINKNLLSKKDMRKLKIITWVTIGLILFNCVTLIFFKMAYDLNWSFMRGIYVSISALLDIELVQIIVFVSMLNYQTRNWNKIIENTYYFEKVNDDEITVDCETVLEEINDALKSVSEAWDLIRNSSGLIIVFHSVITFIQSIFYTEILISWSKTHFGEEHNLILSHAVGMVLLLSKAFFVETQLYIACEGFYREIRSAHTNVILKISQDLPSKRVWKNMFRIIQEDFEKLNACGVFVIDAATLLHFGDLVTTYNIVLLQFAFL